MYSLRKNLEVLGLEKGEWNHLKIYHLIFTVYLINFLKVIQTKCIMYVHVIESNIYTSVLHSDIYVKHSSMRIISTDLNVYVVSLNSCGLNTWVF